MCVSNAFWYSHSRLSRRILLYIFYLFLLFPEEKIANTLFLIVSNALYYDRFFMYRANCELKKI